MDNKLIKEHLSKIASSNHFSNTTKYVDLLTYLVDKALAGEHIKELSIGAEFFKKSYDSAKSDSIVRVNMHNLRKKLDAYYESDGINDGVKFHFQSRSYNLVIDEIPHRSLYQKKRIVAALVGLVTLLLLVGGIAWESMSRVYFWEDFLDPKGSTICIIADHLVVSSQIDGVAVKMHHKDITTKEEFERYTKSKHIDSLEICNFGLFTKSIPYATQRLGQFFGKHGCDFTQLPEQMFEFSATKDANTIYIGQPKLMNLSKLIFLQDSKMFKYDNYQFYVTKEDGSVQQYETGYISRGFNAEYGMVSYAPIKSGKSALFFTSNNDIGIMATIDRFTDHAFLDDLYSRLSSEDSYFNILYKVNGADRVDFNFEIVEIEEYNTH